MMLCLFLIQLIKYVIFDFVTIYKGKFSKYIRKQTAPVKSLIGSEWIVSVMVGTGGLLICR